MNINLRPSKLTVAEPLVQINANPSALAPEAQARQGKATKSLAGRAVRQVFHVAGHAAVLAAKGLWKLGEGLVFVARQFTQAVKTLHRAYQREQTSTEKPLLARKASRQPTESSDHSAGISASTGGAASRHVPQDAKSDAARAAERARRDDHRLAQRIQSLPDPPKGAADSVKRGAYSDFEHSGSNLSGKPLDAKWQRTVDELQARLDELKRPD